MHATTVATNTILERRGARTALITTEGFRDVLEMRRLRIPVLYDLQYEQAAAAGAARGCGSRSTSGWGRAARSGAPLDERVVTRGRRRGQARRASRRSRSRCCTPTPNPAHERRVAEIAARACSATTSTSPARPTSCRRSASTSAPAPRWSTPMSGPSVRDYVALARRDSSRPPASRRRSQIMQSNGGMMSARARAREAGVHGRVRARGRRDRLRPPGARDRLRRTLISLDMGGTTAKAAMIENGEPARTTEYEVGAGINLSSKLVKGGGYSDQAAVHRRLGDRRGRRQHRRARRGRHCRASARTAPAPCRARSATGAGGTEPTLHRRAGRARLSQLRPARRRRACRSTRRGRAT